MIITAAVYHILPHQHPNLVTVDAGGPVCILEVKYDRFLPDLIRDAIQMDYRQTSAFSKYAACRLYG